MAIGRTKTFRDDSTTNETAGGAAFLEELRNYFGRRFLGSWRAAVGDRHYNRASRLIERRRDGVAQMDGQAMELELLELQGKFLGEKLVGWTSRGA